MSATPLDEAAQKAGKSLTIEAGDEKCLTSIRAQLKPGGNGRVKFIVAREQGRRLYEVDIGSGWQLSPALAGAIKVVRGRGGRQAELTLLGQCLALPPDSPISAGAFGTFRA